MENSVPSRIIVPLTLAIPGMVLGETSLSFLGLGLRAPLVSWGVLLQDCMDIKAVSYYPWLMAPVVAIVLAVLRFHVVGDGLPLPRTRIAGDDDGLRGSAPNRPP